MCSSDPGGVVVQKEKRQDGNQHQQPAELCEGGHSVGVRVDVRTSQSDPNTSLLADKQARETTTDGKVTVFLEDDANIGKNAVIVLLDATGQVIDSLTTKLRE